MPGRGKAKRTYLVSQMGFPNVLDEMTDPRVRAGNLIGVEEDGFGTEVERSKKGRWSARVLWSPSSERKRRVYSLLLHDLLDPTCFSLHPTWTSSFLSMHHLPRLFPHRQHKVLLRDLLRPALEFPIVDERVREFHDVAVHSILLREIDGRGGVGFVKSTEEGDVESSETGVGILDLKRRGPKKRIEMREVSGGENRKEEREEVGGRDEREEGVGSGLRRG